MEQNAPATFVQTFEPGEDAFVELRNGRFVDVANGGYFPAGIKVVIQGRRIKAMPGLPGEPTDIMPDFTIDLGGKAVFPGLFNTHSHVSMFAISNTASIRQMLLARKYRQQQIAKNMAECLAHGVTTLRDCYTADLGFYQATAARILRNEIPGPRIYQAVVVGPPNSYLSPNQTMVWRLFSGAMGSPTVDYERKESGSVIFPVNAGESQVRDAVDQAIDERGAHFIKIGEQRESLPALKPTLAIMTAAQLEALTDQARKRNVKTTMHHVSVESFRRGVKHGVSSLAHMPVDAELAKADVEEFQRSGCFIEPTLSVAYDLAWKVPGDPRHSHLDMDRLTEFRTRTWSALADEYYIPEVRESLKRSHDDLSRGVMKMMAFMSAKAFYRYYAGAISPGADNFRLLFEAGVRMGCGNDGGVAPCSPAAIKYEIALFDLLVNSRPGGRRFTGANALRLATIDSARVMGLEESFGTIEAGKVADLAIADGDPLSDVHVVGDRVAALFVDGRLRVDNCGLQVERFSKA